jgi:hypothetical protein
LRILELLFLCLIPISLTPNFWAGIAIMLWNCIQKVLSLIFASSLAILKEVFSGFPQSIKANARIIPQSGHDNFLPNAFQSIIH